MAGREVFDAITFQERFELRTHKTSAVISDNSQTKTSERDSQFFNHSCQSGSRSAKCLNPFGVSVNQDQVRLSLHGTGLIQIQSQFSRAQGRVGQLQGWSGAS